jgi:hypothetical protein
LQKLDIVPRLLPDVRAGRKLHTIRWRERDVGNVRCSLIWDNHNHLS